MKRFKLLIQMQYKIAVCGLPRERKGVSGGVLLSEGRESGVEPRPLKDFSVV